MASTVPARAAIGVSLRNPTRAESQFALRIETNPRHDNDVWSFRAQFVQCEIEGIQHFAAEARQDRLLNRLFRCEEA